MLYIYLPVLYYHGNLYVTEMAYAGRGVFRCPSGLVVNMSYMKGCLNTPAVKRVPDARTQSSPVSRRQVLRLEQGTPNSLLNAAFEYIKI